MSILVGSGMERMALMLIHDGFSRTRLREAMNIHTSLVASLFTGRIWECECGAKFYPDQHQLRGGEGIARCGRSCTFKHNNVKGEKWINAAEDYRTYLRLKSEIAEVKPAVIAKKYGLGLSTVYKLGDYYE